MTWHADLASPLAWLAIAHLGPAGLLLGWLEARFIARRVRLKRPRRLWLALAAGNCAAAWAAWAMLHLDGWPLQAALDHTPWAWLRYVMVLMVPLTMALMLGVKAGFLWPFARASRVRSRTQRRTWWRAFLQANLLTGLPLFFLYGLLSSHSLLWRTAPIRARGSALLDGGRFTVLMLRDGGRVAALDLPGLDERELAVLSPSLGEPVFRFAADAAPGTTIDVGDALPGSVLRTPVQAFLAGDELPAPPPGAGTTLRGYLDAPAGPGPRFAGAAAEVAGSPRAAAGFVVAGRPLALATPLLSLTPREAFVLPDDRLLLLAGDRLLLADAAGTRTAELGRARRVLPLRRGAPVRADR